jgi:hypothetical protein
MGGEVPHLPLRGPFIYARRAGGPTGLLQVSARP